MNRILALLALILALALPEIGLAQPATQPATQPDEVQILLKVLEDDAARARLISHIKEVHETSPPPALSSQLPKFLQKLKVTLGKMNPMDIVQALGLSLLILLLAWGVGRFLSRGLDKGLGLLVRHEETMPGLSMRVQRYAPVLKGAIRALVGLAAALAILEAFGANALALLDGPQGRRFLVSLMTSLLVIGFAVFLWELSSAALEGSLKRLDGQGRRQGRLKSLAPLLRTLVAAILFVLSGLTILSELGVNIAPLLAGAGMIGLAVGLGAQKLVQDILGSISMLIEDTLAVGDAVKIGEHSGVIEKMTLKDIQLRDQSGYLHVIPFSNVSSFVNMTVDFAYAVFEVGVGYHENVDQVMKVLTDLGAVLAEDEAFGQLILEPLEMLGLDKFADSAVILKARLKTEPGKQWVVMREFNRRMKAKFDELGIDMPLPQMVVWSGVRSWSGVGVRS
ncbi:MAG: mechanosensitive ion channel family protein [Alphaproteobacteria bacterium]|nr:mechanosensitive ion channel family protein [Alphaproteobacteria bacterium]